MRSLILLLCLAIVCSSALPLYEITDISNLGAQRVDAIKATVVPQGWKWWIEVGDKLLLLNDGADPVFIIPHIHISELKELENRTLLHNLGFAIVACQKEDIHAALPSFVPIPFSYENLVLAVQTENTHPTPTLPHVGDIKAASISTLVGLVSQDRWFNDVKSLAAYNRYTRGTGIAAAQQWIVSQLQTLGNITVTLQSFTSGSTSGVNVIGTIKGTTTPNNWTIVGGHYDSTSQSPTTSAPGAEDDASGAAAVLEMARILNANPPPCTVLLIFFSGEEQGLLGSAAHAQSLVQSGDSSKVRLMHNMDMIAYQRNPTGPNQVLLETTTTYSSLFSYYRTSAQRYTTLGVFESTTAWGSDHESYIKRGMPGLLTIDKDWDVYPDYHRTTDTPNKLNPTLGYNIIKLGLGAVAQVLGYPF